ncbi:MAG: DUF4831 family protein [Bacteroidales bacterium]|jgi:hypothetical protein|nr:DUF4831 family protein [Bacteroidales bacterium]MDD3151421.1 DUF4831 family protein [Bacteroidales bacterium]MDD3914627.1 DUF4831 family protein [Bacteroidales bacterium]MDD4633804.1 DUF4831 family protein [Bacteroidales bacterium]
MKRLLLLSFFLCLTSTCLLAQVTVAPADDETAGVVYYLPKKSFVVEVTYSKRTDIPGVYAKYAKNLLGINDVITAEKSTYKIENINITPFVEADKKAKYVLKAPETQGKADKAVYVSLSDMGLFCGIGTETRQSDKADDIVMNFADSNVEIPDFNVFSAVSSKFTTVDTTVRVISFDTAFYKFETYSSKAGAVSIEDKAEDAAEKLLEVRQSRLDLLTGFQETNYEAASIKYMDERLTGIENAYLSLFKGYSSVNYYKYSFVYSPENNQVNKEVPVLCFSHETGICTSSKNNGSQVVFLVIPHSEVSQRTQDKSNQHIRYRVPVNAEVFVKYDDRIFAGGVYQIPQLGEIYSIDYQKYKGIYLRPESGNIQNVKVE